MPADAVRDPPQAASSRVSWYELFYDLLVVAALGLVNDAFLRSPSVVTARDALIGFLALSWVWLMSALFANVFPGQDLLRRVLMLVQMGLIIVAALTIDRSIDEVGQRVMFAYAGAMAVVPLLMLTDRWISPGREPAPLRLVGALGAAAGCVALGGLLGRSTLVPLLVTGIVISMVAVLGRPFDTWRADGRLRLDHLRERLGLFVLIVLGEGFAHLVSSLHSLGDIPRAGIFAVTFLVSFALWWIYFEGTFTDQVELTRVRWRLTMIGHFTLVVGMAGTLDILVLLAATEETEIGSHVFEYFAVCVVLALLSFALLRFAATRRIGAPGVLEVVSAVAIGALGFVLGEGPLSELDLLITVSAIAVVVNAIASAWHGRQSGATLGYRLRALVRGESA